MMKRLIPLLLLLLAVLLTVPALAASTEEEWNASCNWVITQDTTLYSASYIGDISTTTDLYTFTPAGAIAAGSRVTIRSSYEDMRQISYWHGGQRSAWVKDSAVRWASASAEPETEGTGSTGTSGYYGGGSRSVAYTGVWGGFDVTLLEEDGTETDVFIETLGTAQCIVFDGEEIRTVATADLVWDTEAPEDQRMAVIHAPRTGKATLRASASNSSRALGQCAAGKIVVVLKVGKVYTRVLYDGQEGCVYTSALTFFPVLDKEDVATAILSYNDRTDTSATISVYTATNANRKIDQYRVGNEVAVFGESGSWTEIELDGYHCYVLSKYLD
ncbi:MAG: hypothetical protein IJZ74_00865 [Clostridia bacterium]|nr:hypothetical protein [Clostridia bacterium]